MCCGPIVVRPVRKVSVGCRQRRWRNAREADGKNPALVREISPGSGGTLVENLRREDLSPLEAPPAYRNSYTQEQVAQDWGWTARSYQSARLLKLPEPVRRAIAERKLTAGHGKVLAGIREEDHLLTLFAQTMNNRWSVRQLEAVATKGPEKVRFGRNRLPK